MKCAALEGCELALNGEVALLSLEDELFRIRRSINKEENPVRKAKMINVYRKMSRMLTAKEP
jgi:hypothetical protein